MVAYALIVSSGTLLAAAGFGIPALTGGALYYLLGSTLAASAFFLLIELLDRSRLGDRDPAFVEVPRERQPFAEPAQTPLDANLDDDERALIGRAVPGPLIFLGLSFAGCALVIAGMPPFSGFLAKVAMLTALLRLDGATAPTGTPDLPAWVLLALLIVSGLASLIALLRLGIRYFWVPHGGPAPKLRLLECVPVALLLALCAALLVGAGPVVRFTDAAARTLLQPDRYIDAVMSARDVPAPPKRTTPP